MHCGKKCCPMKFCGDNMRSSEELGHKQINKQTFRSHYIDVFTNLSGQVFTSPGMVLPNRLYSDDVTGHVTVVAPPY